MGAYGNTQAECEVKINGYKNPDKRCDYPFTCGPLGYCWSFAHHIDGTKGYEDMDKICPGCECWAESDQAHLDSTKEIDV